jgi:hypothetical protein
VASKRKRNTSGAPDAQAGVEPTTRTFTSWTPNRILNAEILADSGQMRLAADLCDWILGDDKAGPLLMGRAQFLLGLDPSFEKSGDKRRSGRAVRALEADEDYFTAYPESELSLFIVWGILLGVAPGRHEWVDDQNHGNRTLPNPKFWHPHGLRHDGITRQWKILVAATATSAGSERVLTPGDSEWLLHQPYGTHRPWSYGLWRGLARLCLLKAYAIGSWAQKAKKAQVLATTVDRAIQSTPEQRAQLAQDIYDRGIEGVVALPPGFDIKLLTTQSSVKETQEAQIRLVDEAIATAIRGGNLTTNVTGGSLAATEAQATLGDESKRAFDAQALTTTIHDQSLTWWAEFNFGDPSLAPWPVYPVEPEEDLKAKVEADEKALANCQKAEQLGFEVDRKAFLEQHKITWAKPGTPKNPADTTPTVPATATPPVEPSPNQPAPTG